MANGVERDLVLADGRARVVVTEYSSSVLVHEFSAKPKRTGVGRLALAELGCKFSGKAIAALDISQAPEFWWAMHREGLVSALVDEDGEELT